MNLRNASLLYLFLETPQVDEQQHFLETIVRLPVIETDTNPRSKHGLVKFDAGSLMISLNRSPFRRFPPDSSDGMLTIFAQGSTRITDRVGHHYLLDGISNDIPPRAVELVLHVGELASSITFYRDVLGFEPIHVGRAGATFRTGTIPISLTVGSSAIDGRRIRYTSYLLVLHTPDIERTSECLTSNGVAFSSKRISESPPGRTLRFKDPSGHQFCLYQPSPAALEWPSGPKLRQIVGGVA